MFRNVGRIYFFIFSIQNIKSKLLDYFFFKFFPIIFLMGSLFFPNYIYINSLFFVILSGCPLVFHDLTRLFLRTESIYYPFFIDEIYCCFVVVYSVRRVFISNTIRIYFINIYNAINEYNQRQTHYLSSMFLTQFDI